MEKDHILNKRSTPDKTSEENKSVVLYQGVAFYLNNSLYAIDVMSIKEFYSPDKIYQVPNTTKHLLGVLNLRGFILPVYSLKLILGMPEDLNGTIDFKEYDKYIVIIRKEKDVFGILIDSIYNNVIGTEDNYRSGNYLNKWSENALFKAVILENEKQIFVIDMDHLLKYIISFK